MLSMDTIVVVYDFGFKMGSPRAYTHHVYNLGRRRGLRSSNAFGGNRRRLRLVHSEFTTNLHDFMRIGRALIGGDI